MRCALALLGLIIACWSTQSRAQSPVYFLAVGSSRYLPPADPADHGFQKLDGARNGAMMLADRLTLGGARFGIALTSPEGSPVSLADFNRAVEDLLARIARDKSGTPILIVYIAAHGISDGFAWNHFSVPGDLTYRGDPGDLSVEQLSEQAIHAATLVDRLNRAELRYILILDTCYEGTPSRFDSPVLNPVATQNIGGIAQALRVLNEFHQDNPVLFSTTPGSTVPVAPDPTDPTTNSVGPLARRLIRLVDANTASGKVVSVSDIVASVTSPFADALTRPAVSHAEPAPWWATKIIGPGTAPGDLDLRDGAATDPRLCCLVVPVSTVSAAQSARGTIRLFGSPGEFISDGETLTLSAGINLERPDPGSLILHVADSLGDWTLRFERQPSLSVGTYKTAGRAGFVAKGAPGLSIEGRGHGCNEVRGEFEIGSLPTASKHRLKLHFRQICDDINVPLLGEVDLEITAAAGG